MVNPDPSKPSAADRAAPDPVGFGRPSAHQSAIHRWLARLATSFAIVAAVLAWEGYQSLVTGAAIWRTALDLFGASAAVAMAFVGTRERHRAARRVDSGTSVEEFGPR